MKIYDISQKVFGGEAYPGDPIPERRVLLSMEEGAICNLTAFFMCAHNGTHLDAPYHFLKDGETVDRIPLSQTVGWCYVAEVAGEVDAEKAKSILRKAKQKSMDAAKRILLKGKATVTAAAARVFADAKVLLIGNESQTVGPENAPMEVHLILLSVGCVLLEGIRLEGVSEGSYVLFAAPLALEESDGAPCRAVLVDIMDEGSGK